MYLILSNQSKTIKFKLIGEQENRKICGVAKDICYQTPHTRCVVKTGNQTD